MALSRVGMGGRTLDAGAGWLAGKLVMLLTPDPDTISSIERSCLSKAERSEILASSGAEVYGAGSGASERKLSRNEDERGAFVSVFECALLIVMEFCTCVVISDCVLVR